MCHGCGHGYHKARRDLPTSNQLVESINDRIDLLWRCLGDLVPETSDRKCSDPVDLHPGPFWQPGTYRFRCKRKTGTLRLTCEHNGNDGPGPFVEYILAQNENRTKPGLLMSTRRVEVRPNNIAPQYSGHSSVSESIPSSAMACSNTGSSFAHSRARLPRSIC